MMVVSRNDISCPHGMHVKLISGACFMNVKPLFSHDSLHIIIACGSEVKVFSIKSGECVQTLRYHSRPVISIKENKVNILQIFSCSEDGVVVRWDYMEGKALQVYDLRVEIVTFYPLQANEQWLITRKFEDQFRLYSVQPKKSVSRFELILKPVLPKENTIAYGFMDKFVASVMDNCLTIYKFDASSSMKHKYGTRTLKCVACHPSDFVIATGDCHGRIVLWSNALVSNHPIRSIYHWHSLPVSDLAFSPEGSYLHSGGGEATLVKWNLFSEEKSILPRMGAPILNICASKDNCYVTTLHSDNVLQVTDSQRNVVQVIQGLTNSDSPFQKVGLLYNAHLKALVMNGKPGHLQFYDIQQDKQLFNLDIAGKNYLSQERETTINNIDVQKAAIDENGLWLATAEYWCKDELSPHIWLKFWAFNLEKQTFVLNTNVWLPHNKSLNCILFNQMKHGQQVVTTSDDGRFKIWQLNDKTDGSKPHWICDAMGYYRDFPAGSASFSEDGSLLAVAFESVATLWNVEGIALKAVLCHDRSKGDVKQLLFGHNSCSHYLVCHDSSSLTVWNVLTLSIPWIIDTEVQVLTADPLSDNVAAFCNNQRLIIFKPSSSHPVHRFENVSETAIISAIFVPSKNVSEEKEEGSDEEEERCFHDQSQLFFFNENQNLLTLSEKTEDEETSTSNKKTVAQTSIETPFAMLQAVHKKSDVQKLESEQFTIGEEDEEIIPNPLLQDPQILCASILESLMKPLKIKDNDVDPKPSEPKKEKEVKMPFSTPLPDWMDELKNMKPTFMDFSFLQQTVSFSRSKDKS